MYMKKGITMSVVLIAIVIMIVLITSATVVGTTSISTARYEEFKSTVARVADNVNEYYLNNGTLPVKKEIISSASLNADFRNELSRKGDLEEKLYVVDMGKINDASITIGRNSTASEDVFLVSEKSQNVYYLKGVTFKKVKYHGV